MKTIAPALLMLLCPGCAGIQLDAPPATVEWESERAPSGEVMASDLIDDVELGRRSDGVVVWRSTAVNK